MWARFALSLGIGVIVVVALILFVDHNNSNSEAAQSPQAIARANQEATIVVQQDQAPHVLPLAPGATPHATVLKAVRHDMTTMITNGVINGPLQKATCRRTPGRPGIDAFSCNAVAANVSYPFLGVVDLASRRLTYCKRDLPPVPSLNIPVSPRCRA